MPQADAGGIRLEYETIGSPADRPLVLIMGLSTQLVAWPDRFCRMLADAGHYVIRFDNRDVGLSTKLDELGVPNLEKLREDGCESATPAYSLSDMAVDAVGLLDHLGIEKAHFCGLSMGGMIAQIVAIESAGRVDGLISMQSTTSEPDLPGSTPEATRAMMSKPPLKREAYIDYQAEVYRAFSGGSEHYDQAVQRKLSARAHDRMFYPNGFARQMAAILCAPGRRKALAMVTAPTLVIHGDCDTVVPPAHGQDTATAVSGAKLALVEGLGHGMAYPSLWKKMVSVIASHTKEASGR